MINSANYSVNHTNWRQQLAINNRRTRIVIAVFILIYLLLGLLVDIYLNLPGSSSMPTTPYYDFSLSNMVQQLITFKIFPYATVTMGMVAAISLFITYKFYDKIMLLGTNYSEVTQEQVV